MGGACGRRPAGPDRAAIPGSDSRVHELELGGDGDELLGKVASSCHRPPRATAPDREYRPRRGNVDSSSQGGLVSMLRTMMGKSKDALADTSITFVGGQCERSHA
jgi:hypothetical protein